MINGVMVVKNVDTMNVRTGSADQVGLNLTSDSNDIDEEVKNTPTAGIAVPSSVVVPPKVHHPLPKRFVAPSNNDAADSLDWTDSLFPVYTYKEFMTDFYKVMLLLINNINFRYLSIFILLMNLIQFFSGKEVNIFRSCYVIFLQETGTAICKISFAFVAQC